MRRAVLLLLLAACATSHKLQLEQHTEEQGAATQQSEETGQAKVDVSEKTQTGPVHEVFTGRKTIPSAVPGRPPIVLQGTWTTDTGPSLSELNAKSVEEWKRQEAAKEALERQQVTQLKTASTMKPALSCAFGGWLVIVAVIAVALFAWRLLRRA